ncbi:MAG TPA: TAXI family TRAP transporter solute-binding subunit [Candidatus Scatomorpha merdigallinarum]|nr:TAXI family TRAP transporter solute-binding subunit [Candidatus Scatomorpha merdigallinarum]
MKKRLLALSLALVMVFVLAACGESTTDPSAEPSTAPSAAVSVGPADVPDVEASANLQFGTGSPTGTYYGFGSTFGTYISNNTGVSITAVSTAGSQANIEMVDAGEYDLGFVQSDVMSYAYAGTNLFTEPVTGFTTLAALYMEQVQIVTLDPEIKTVADLEGKTVSIGAVGSGVYFNALDVLGAYGLTEEDIDPVTQNFDDSVESLQDGRIDAAFIVAGAPTTSITQLATTNDVYLVSLDQEHIDALIETSPYYSAYTISKDVYGTEEDCTTVAISAVLIGSADLDPDVAYTIVYTLFQNADKISHLKASELDIEFASSITDVPYNEGAARYFSEQGIEVPTA